MEITLSVEDQKLVDELVAKGAFSSTDEVINASLTLMKKEEDWKTYVRSSIDEGMREALAGNFASDEELDALFEKYRQKTA